MKVMRREAGGGGDLGQAEAPVSLGMDEIARAVEAPRDLDSRGGARALVGMLGGPACRRLTRARGKSTNASSQARAQGSDSRTSQCSRPSGAARSDGSGRTCDAKTSAPVRANGSSIWASSLAASDLVAASAKPRAKKGQKVSTGSSRSKASE
jgi:hypothetical protein